MDGGRFDRAEGGLLAADRACRRASEWAEAAGVTLEEVNAAVGAGGPRDRAQEGRALPARP